jgi:hypothetical protein
VIRTSNSPGFDVTVFQGRSSMGAVKPYEPKAAAAIAEKYQLLAQNFDRSRDVF